MENRKIKRRWILFCLRLASIGVLTPVCLFFGRVNQVKDYVKAEEINNNSYTGNPNNESQKKKTRSIKKDVNFKQSIKINNQSSLDRILELFRKHEKKGGTRTTFGETCLVLSDQVKQSLVSWSDRPLFVWKGHPKQVGLSSMKDGLMLWTHKIEEQQQHIQYDGTIPLKRGEKYIYWIRYQHWKKGEQDIGYQVPFTIMSESDSQVLERELQFHNLNTSNEKELVSSLILNRSMFFTQKKLFLDAVRELHNLPRNSPELKMQLEELECILSPD